MESLLAELLSQFQNPWVLFGFAAQFVFFLRFIIQWIASERAQTTVVPNAFWYLSIVGALMILIYAIYRLDIVFIAGQGAALMIYVRNLVLAGKHHKHNVPTKYTRTSAGPTSAQKHIHSS